MCCRQDLTWKELQPILLPDVLVHDAEAPSAHPAKPKRKLQKVNTHTRDLQAKPTASDALGASAAATAALPSASQAAARVGKTAKAAAASAAAGKGKKAHRHSSYDDEEAVLADEPIRSNTPAGSCLAYMVSYSCLLAVWLHMIAYCFHALLLLISKHKSQLASKHVYAAPSAWLAWQGSSPVTCVSRCPGQCRE